MPMTCTATLDKAAAMTLQRAQGEARVSSKPGPRGAVIDTLFQKGAMKLVFPRGKGRELAAVLVNTAGGVTGGDHFRTTASAGPESRLTLTTQAAERAYKALPGQTGRIRTQLRCSADARLDWLPQETILFDGADIDRRLRCDIAKGGETLIVEPLIFGRAAMGERRISGHMTDRIEIFRDGQLAYLDAWTLAGDLSGKLDRPGIAQGHTAMASLIYAGPRAEAILDPLRAQLGANGGASLVAPDLLVARVLAADGYALRRVLIPTLDDVSEGHLPTCWRL